MKGYLAFIVVLGLLVSACTGEEDASPAQVSTYIKLFGGSSADKASMALPVDDGGTICLGTAEVETAEGVFSRMRLIKTDMYGNVEWQKIYPSENETHSLIGKAVLPVEDGYILTGDSIKDAGNSALIIFKVDLSGNEVSGMKTTDTLENASLHGIDLLRSETGDLLVLAEVKSDATANDLYLASVNGSDLSIDTECSKFYSGGSVSAVKSLYYEPSSGEVAFGGTVNAFSSGNVRMFRVPGCTSSLISGPLLVQSATKNYTVSQIIPAGNGFALAGTTNDTDNGTSDIFLAGLGPLGTVRFLKIFSSVAGISMTGEEQGLALAATDDGGFVITGSTRTRTRGEEDIIIIKTDAYGNEAWSKRFGDANEEQASWVQQTSDGGYLIFGNTEFGSIDTMILIKTDSEGNVE